MVASIAVVGATSWGTTLAWLLAGNGHQVWLAVRSEREAVEVRARRGIARLPEVTLPKEVAVVPSTDVPGSIDGMVLAVPAQAVRRTLAEFDVSREVPVLSAAKGFEHDTTLRMSEVLVALGWASSKVAALSGPNLAHEIARGLPAAAVVACTDEVQAARWQQAVSTGAYRAYRSTDVTGVEVAGALKNVIAIAAGAAAALDLGTNTMATILTRGLAEMTRLGTALGADPLTFQGLAGVGDLAATCFSPLSRNRRLGELIARGRSPEEALAAIGEVAEGASTAAAAVELGTTNGVELPIAAQVAAALDGRVTATGAMAALLGRTLKPEANDRR